MRLNLRLNNKKILACSLIGKILVLHIKVTGSIPVWSKKHVAEMAIAAALKVVTYTVYGFESHHVFLNLL